MSVKMTDEEIANFLSENLVVTAITINPDGTPLPAPVWFINKEAEMFFSTQRRLQKAKNIARDPRCVMQVETGDRYRDLRAVIVTGKAQEMTEAEYEWFKPIYEDKYSGLRNATTAKFTEATKKYYDNPRVYYRVVPAKVKSWDNRKIILKD